MRSTANQTRTRIRIRCHFILCAGIAFSTIANAQSPLSIDEAVAHALTHNAGMAQTRAALSGKQEELLAAQRLDWPTLGLELTALHGSGEPTSFSAVNGQNDPDAPVTKPVTGEYGVSTVVATAPIFQNGAFFFQKSPLERMASGSILKAQSDVDIQAVDLSNQIAQAFLNALSATEQQTLQQSAADKLQHRLEVVRTRVRSGLDSRADELTAEAALAGIHSDLNAAGRLRKLQLLQLSLSLGDAQSTQIDILPIAADFPQAPAIDETLGAALESHPALRSQAANLAVAKSTLDSQRGEGLPRVTFDVSRTEAGNFYDVGTNRFVSAGFKLSMPLLDSGQGSAKVRAHSYAVIESEQKMLLLRTTLTLDAYQRYYAYQDAVDMFEAGKADLAKAEHQERESDAKHAKKLIGLDALLEDEVSLLAARVSQIKLRYNAWVAWADFIKSLGRPFSTQLAATSP